MHTASQNKTTSPSHSDHPPVASSANQIHNPDSGSFHPPYYTFPRSTERGNFDVSFRDHERPPPYAQHTFSMAEGENLLGLVDTGIPRHGRTTRRPRAQTASAADKRARASSDASSGYGGEANWERPPALGRNSSEYAQSRNNLLSADERTPLLGSQSLDRNASGARSHRSVSVSTAPYDPEALVTPRRPRPSSWKNMLRAPSQMNTPTLRVIDTPNGEAIVVTRPKKKKHPVVRYLSPLWSGTHWLALVHLIFINLPLVSLRPSDELWFSY